MSLTEMQAKLKGRIWQAVAQSGVDVSFLPQAEMDKLVEAITAGVLAEMNDALSQMSGKPASSSTVANNTDNDEQILWEGRPFMSISVQYQITTERVRIAEGLLGKEREDIELVRIQDIDYKQNLSERMLNIGDIYIRSRDASNPKVILNNVTDPEEVHELLRRAVLKARKRYKLGYRTEM